MIKELLKVPDQILFAIGRDYSVDGTREQVARKLAEIFRSYGFRWSDVASRYGLHFESSQVVHEDHPSREESLTRQRARKLVQEFTGVACCGTVSEPPLGMMAPKPRPMPMRQRFKKKRLSDKPEDKRQKGVGLEEAEGQFRSVAQGGKFTYSGGGGGYTGKRPAGTYTKLDAASAKHKGKTYRFSGGEQVRGVVSPE